MGSAQRTTTRRQPQWNRAARKDSAQPYYGCRGRVERHTCANPKCSYRGTVPCWPPTAGACSGCHPLCTGAAAEVCKEAVRAPRPPLNRVHSSDPRTHTSLIQCVRDELRRLRRRFRTLPPVVHSLPSRQLWTCGEGSRHVAPCHEPLPLASFTLALAVIIDTSPR
jgi:hypothetical protein